MLRFALSLRFLMLFASLGTMLGALLMFWAGGAKLVKAVSLLLTTGQEDAIGTYLMSATDAFLFGLVLVVFSYAITFGFAFDLTKAQRQRLPEWMRIHGLAELKQTLIQIILVYLIVDFATDVSEPGMEPSWQTLVMPAAILLLAGAMRLMASPLTEADSETPAPAQDLARPEP